MLKMSVYTAVIISISRKVEVSQKQRCRYLIHMGQVSLMLQNRDVNRVPVNRITGT